MCPAETSLARAVAEKYDVAQRLYTKLWTPTASHYFDQGVYRWLAGQLDPIAPCRVLDVGCGTGHGLVALYQVHGPCLEVVALDENLSCLKEARGRLETQGIPVDLLTRFSPRTRTPYGYVHETEPLPMATDALCVLVESDVANDPYLEPWLEEGSPFDVVTLWFTGTHTYRQFSAASKVTGVSNDEEHRLFVQRMVHRLAAKALRPEGVLQICDRVVGSLSDMETDATLNVHCHAALGHRRG